MARKRAIEKEDFAMKRYLLSFAAPLALGLVPTGALAQQADEAATGTAQMDQAMSAFAEAFIVEPLTAEQEARLPLARSVVERIMPPGTLGEMMGSMFEGVLGPLGAMSQPGPAAIVAQQLGLAESDLTMDDQQAARAAAMFDPAWEERGRRQAEALPAVMGAVMATMEPAMRSAMSELYAVHFSDGELADIAAFFATPSGGAYARKSYSLASDPRLLAAVFTEMPALMGSMMTMQQQLDEATADLPSPRTYADLSATERKRLADMVGLNVDDLEYSTQWGAGAAAEAAAGAMAAAGAYAGDEDELSGKGE